MKKVLIVDDVHEILIDRLAASGIQCTYMPKVSKEEALVLLPAYEGLVIRSKFLLTQDILKANSQLKWIGRAGAGMDNIDMRAADSMHIACLNAPEGNRDAVAEHAIGLFLSLSNYLYKGNQQIRNQRWDREGNRGEELKAKTVGVIGYGYMGRCFVSKLRGFSCGVLAYDKFKSGFSSDGVQEASLPQIFEETDILSLHLPLTSESRGMFNKEFISSFKKPFYFINTSRGEIVNTEDLIWGLEQQKIKGAGLDVLANEKFPLSGSDLELFERLSEFPNVLFSPHVAGWSVESYRKISEVLAEKVLEFYAENKN